MTLAARKGQTWKHHRDPWREVYVTGTSHEYGKTYVHVTRNTSRRRQRINLTTLQRDYRLAVDA